MDPFELVANELKDIKERLNGLEKRESKNNGNVLQRTQSSFPKAAGVLNAGRWHLTPGGKFYKEKP